MELIKVSDNKRFLTKEDGSPFFWLGDTAWELFHRLNREDAELYLRTRTRQGFNVIQAVALAEFEGITVPNAYGRKPLLQNAQGEYDPTQPDVIKNSEKDYTYWDHVDFIVNKAAELGIYIALLPTWGDKYNIAWGKGPEVFNGDNAFIYGKWIGERYKDKNNVIWVLGGDRPLTIRRHFETIKEMALGIKEGDSGKHLITFHPCGGTSSSFHNHEQEWLDFNMIQSGHDCTNKDNYRMVSEDYERLPVKPVLDAEPRYEDHPIGFNPQNGYFDEFDVRQAAYWAVFAGAFGHTYGHHSVWSMCKEPYDYIIMHWQKAIVRPGAEQMQYLKRLIESRPFFERIPDQELISDNYKGANHIQATRGKHYAFIYSPNGLTINVVMGKISGETVNAYWYDPRKGKAEFVDKFVNQGIIKFTPPSSGRKDDWVLVLDDVNSSYKAPGMC